MSVADRARGVVDALLETTVVGSFSRLGYSARRALFDWDAEPGADLSGRIALVTGANGGIGLATAHALAAQHADLWLVGRDAERIETARREVLAATPDTKVSTVVADLAVLDDVRACAETVLHDSARLDVIVHNAGALVHELHHTVDGLEVTAQVHVVAPFLLTTSLLPLLRGTGGARVVTVSSGGMYTQRLALEELAAPGIPFNGTRAYANAKRAQVVLNERWTREHAAAGITFQAMHPGWADTPGVQASLPRFRSVMRPLLRTPEQAADTAVWLAGSPEAIETNGEFWLDRRRRLTSPLPWTRTPNDTADRLWNWCVDHAGVGATLRSTP